MAIDPYETWLGIPADRRPPTYYDLLGVAPDESDQAVIEKASLRRMSNVRVHQIGPHSDQSQDVLNELSRARVILMDPDRRAEYDAKIGARGRAAVPENVGSREAQPRLPEPDKNVANVLSSLALSEQKGDESLTEDAFDDGDSGWKKTVIVGAIVVCNAAMLGVGGYLFYHFRPANVKQEAPDIARNDPDPAVPITRPKRPAPPAAGPVELKKKAPPAIVSVPLENSSLAGITAPKSVDSRARAGGAEQKRPEQRAGGGGPSPQPPNMRATRTRVEQEPTDPPSNVGIGMPFHTPEQRDLARPVPAQPVSIAERLEKARKEYQETLDSLKGPMLNRLVKAVRVASKNKNLQLMTLQQEERRLFGSKGQIPSSIDTSDYEEKVKKARRKYWSALDKVKDYYFKQSKTDSVRELDRAQEELEKADAAGKPWPLKDGILLATGQNEEPATWWYTTKEPRPGWLSFRFKPNGWSQGKAGFGSTPTPGETLNTICAAERMWLWREVNFPIPLPSDEVTLRVFHDCQVAKVYVNGELLIQREGFGRPYYDIPLDPRQAALFHPGLNKIAVFCDDKGGFPTGIDIGLYVYRHK